MARTNPATIQSQTTPRDEEDILDAERDLHARGLTGGSVIVYRNMVDANLAVAVVYGAGLKDKFRVVAAPDLQRRYCVIGTASLEDNVTIREKVDVLRDNILAARAMRQPS
jgi:hypothetical protein